MQRLIKCSRIGTAAVVLGSAVLFGCGKQGAPDLIASGRALAAKGDFSGATIQLKSALQSNPQSAEARFLLGEVMLQSGAPKLAVLELERAQELGYDDNKVLPALAKALLGTGQAAKVVERYARVRLTEPVADANLMTLVAGAYEAQGKIAQSEAVVDAALQIDPKNTTARLLRARMLVARGKVDDGLAVIDGVLAEDPKRRDALHLKGALLWAYKQDTDAAIKAFRDVLVIDPRYMPAHAALISLMMQRRDVSGFKAQVAAVSKAIPTSPETRFYEAQLALAQKDYKRAREITQQLLRVAPTNVKLLQLLGAIEFNGGSLLVAESHLAKALQESPELPLARRLLAETHLRMGQPQKAIATLQSLLQQNPESAQALALAAEAYLQLGDAAKAETFFRQAAKADPNDSKAPTALALSQISRGYADAGFAQLEALATTDASAYADLALVSARLLRNDTGQALAAIDRLQTKMADKPLPYQLRGRVLALRKDYAGARASYDRALALDPAYFPAITALSGLDVAEGRPEAARKRFEALLAREPNNYRAMLAIAELQRSAGVPPAETATLLASAIRANPSEAAPRQALIEHHLRLRDALAARNVAQDAVAALPDDLQLVDALGRAQLAAADYQQAISAFRKVVAAQPAAVQPQLRLADAYILAKDYASAKRTLSKILETHPTLLAAQSNLAQIALTDKRADEAVGIARTVQKQRPTEAVGFLMEGDIHAAQKQSDGAINAYRLALTRSPTTETASRLYSSYAGAGRSAEADRFAASWERDHPRDAGFQFQLGSNALALKDYATAEARYRRVLELRPDHALALNNLAWLLVRSNKPGALPFAERANKLLPGQPSMMDTLAAALAADNRIEMALTVQKEVVSKAPGVPGYRLQLARLLAQHGDKSSARSELEKLAKLGDSFAGQAEVASLLRTL